MRELSDEAQAMLNATRGAHDPTDRDRRRLRGAMVAQLGAAAVVSSSATLAAAAGGSVAAGGILGAVKVVATVAVLSFAAGTVAWQTTRPTHPAPAASAATRRIALAAVSPAPPPDAAVARTEAVPCVAPIASAVPVATTLAVPARALAKPLADPAQQNDALAKQVHVLAAVRSDLRQGRADQALAALDSQTALFKQGALREEFLAARVLALRALGRAPDADAAEARFAEEMPHSALASKIGTLSTEPVEK